MFADVLKIARRTYQYTLKLTPLADPNAEEEWRILARLGRLYVAIAYIAGQPVAFSYAHELKGTAMLKTPGYNPEYAYLSIGQHCLLKLIRTLIESRSVRVLDYGLGYSQYKEALVSRCVMEGHVRIYAPTWKGLLLIVTGVASRGIGQVLRRAIETLGLRTHIRRWIRSR